MGKRGVSKLLSPKTLIVRPHPTLSHTPLGHNENKLVSESGLCR